VDRIYVFDANVLFSGMLSGKAFYEDLVTRFEILIPGFALLEIQKYEERLLAKGKLDKQQLLAFTARFFRYVTVIPDFAISATSKVEAATICASLDPMDTAYVALALEFNATLVSQDKKLIVGLDAFGKPNAMSLTELVTLL
jgi:predicted nucleic acid-binding protein